jgi:hypothetical protein
VLALSTIYESTAYRSSSVLKNASPKKPTIEVQVGIADCEPSHAKQKEEVERLALSGPFLRGQLVAANIKSVAIDSEDTSCDRHGQRFSLKDLAPANIKEKSTTFCTFHFTRPSPTREDAPENIEAILETPEVSKDDRP